MRPRRSKNDRRRLQNGYARQPHDQSVELAGDSVLKQSDFTLDHQIDVFLGGDLIDRRIPW
jgi:hypothetical protein